MVVPYPNLFRLGYGCDPQTAASAPPTLSYATPQSWTYGAAISTLSPTTTGATSFAVTSGALPTGVTLDTGTGVLSGTPTQAKVAANVEITATGPGGSIAATVNIAVPSPMYTDLKAYYDADEASGVLDDKHSGGLDFTDNNTVTQAAGVGAGQNSRQFTAANTEYFSRANHAALVGAAASWSRWGWVRLDSNVAIRFIMDCNNGVTGWSMYVQGNVLRSLIGTGSANVSLAHGSVPDTTWVFWYVEFNGTHLRASVDDGAFGSSAAAAHAPSSAPVNIGAALGGALPMNGRQQAIGFADRVLTAAEITWLYNGGAAARLYAELATYNGG